MATRKPFRSSGKTEFDPVTMIGLLLAQSTDEEYTDRAS
jgi:hypothetical protein